MNQYPPPDEYELHKKRLDALRPWHRFAWVALGIFLVIAIWLHFERLG